MAGPWAARLFKDTYLAMIAHCCGEDELPETLRLMCRRAAAIEAECINLEARSRLLAPRASSPRKQTSICTAASLTRFGASARS
jgi:hypothetical protein